MPWSHAWPLPRLSVALGAVAAVVAALTVVACQSDPTTSQVDTEVRLPTALPAIDWASAPDCLARLRLLEQTARSERLPDDPDEVPIVVRIASTPGAWSAFDQEVDWIQADLPLRILPPDAQPRGDVMCWIEVGPARGVEADLREVGHDQVRSAYQQGSKSERNPEYEVAQLRVRQAERELRESSAGIIAVGDPMLDLVGLMVGSVFDAFSGRARRSDLEEAIGTLAATQRSLEQPVWRHYHFERTLFRGRKSALIPASIRSPSGPERRTVIRQREQRTFEVIDGLDPRDRDYEAHDAASVTDLELQRWTGRPPILPISALIRALIDPTAEPSEDLAPDPDSAPPLERTFVAEGGETTAATPRPRRRGATTSRHTMSPPSPSDTPTGTLAVSALEALKGSPTRRAIPIALPKPRTSAGAAALSAAEPRRGLPDVVTFWLDGTDRGIGVYLSPHTVITTASTVGGAGTLEAEVDGIRLPALVAASDPVRDLALVKLPRAGVSAPLDDDPAVGGALSLLAPGASAPMSRASIAEPRAGSARLEVTLAPSATPALGAPLLSEGRLVGIVTAVDGRTAHAAPGRAIRDLLDQLPNSDLLLD